MLQERLEDLSIYYWVKSNFPDFVNVVDGFPLSDLVLPTISVEWEDLVGENFELGNRVDLKTRTWYIDVFAKNKSQRDEFVYQLYNDLNNGISVYNYNEGFPEQGITPSKIGQLLPKTRQLRNIHVDDSSVEELYYRAVCIFTAVYEQQ